MNKYIEVPDEPVMVACPHCKKEFNIDDGLFDEEEEEDE